MNELNIENIMKYADTQTILSYYGIKYNYHTKKIKCFVHNDNRPSMKVFENQNRFYCFSCGENKSIIDLVQKEDNCDIPTALIRIDSICNLGLNKELTAEEKRQQALNKRLKMQEKQKEEELLLKRIKRYEHLQRESKWYQDIICKLQITYDNEISRDIIMQLESEKINIENEIDCLDLQYNILMKKVNRNNFYDYIKHYI